MVHAVSWVVELGSFSVSRSVVCCLVSVVGFLVDIFSCYL